MSQWTAERLRFLWWPVAALMAAFFVSSVFSTVPSLSALAFSLVVGIVGFCFLSSALIEDDTLRDRVWSVVAVAILLLAVRVVIWRLDEGLDVAAFQLLNNAWLGKLQLAWVFNLFAPLLLARFIIEERRSRAMLHGAAWATSGVATYVLFSRMGSLVFTLTAVGVCVLNPGYWRRWIVILAGGAAVAVILFLRSMEMTGFLVSTLVELDRNPGVQMRLEVWQDALQMFRNDPVLGIGLGTYDEVAYTMPGTRAVADFRQDGWHAHNTFLHVLVEAGVLGLLAWCYLWCALVGHLWRRWRSADPAGRLAASGALAAVAAFFVMSLTEVLIAARAHESLRMNMSIGLVLVMGLHSGTGGDAVSRTPRAAAGGG